MTRRRIIATGCSQHLNWTEGEGSDSCTDKKKLRDKQRDDDVLYSLALQNCHTETLQFLYLGLKFPSL